MLQRGVLQIDEMVGIGVSTMRQLQACGRSWPSDVTIVSPGSHWVEGDICIEHFPEELKTRAPKMQFKHDAWHLTVDDKPMFADPTVQYVQFECMPGLSNAEDRIRDITAEGIDKELIFSQRTIGLYAAGDVDLRQYFYRASITASSNSVRPTQRDSILWAFSIIGT